jgi:hypothetical protein
MNNVCRSLFEKDKLLFSFLLAAKVMTGDGKLDQAEARFFLQGSISMALRKPNPVTAVWRHVANRQAVGRFPRLWRSKPRLSLKTSTLASRRTYLGGKRQRLPQILFQK